MLDRIIFSTADLSESLRTRLREASGNTCEVLIGNEIPDGAEVLLVSDTRWLNTVNFAQLKKLRLVQTLSAGIDVIDFEKIPDNVQVCGNVGAFAEPIGEHVFGMMLALAKNLLFRNDELKRSIFDQGSGTFLKGKTLGIVGTGGIGQAVARLAKAFGMTTHGINSSGRSVEYFDRTDNISGLDNLMTTSDVIVLAVPLTLNTLNLINESNLRLMKKNCILINVGRGRVIDEKALYDHLRENPSFKAGIDVWWKYPEKGKPFAQDFPFFDLPNFLGSPHNADAVPESLDLALNGATKNIERYLKGEPLKGLARRKDYLGLKVRA